MDRKRNNNYDTALGIWFDTSSLRRFIEFHINVSNVCVFRYGCLLKIFQHRTDIKPSHAVCPGGTQGKTPPVIPTLTNQLSVGVYGPDGMNALLMRKQSECNRGEGDLYKY